MIPNSNQRRRRVLVASLAVVLALTGVACGGGDGEAGGGQAAAAGEQANTVVLKLIAFKPERLEVKAGTTVTWRNDDGTAHTVTSGTVRQEGGGVQSNPDGMFDSGDLATGKAFTFTVKSPGAYSYFCKFHPATMRGEIVVT